MQYNRNRRTYALHRYPTTTDKSLRPISAADELLLDWLDDQPAGDVSVYHDRFGVLTTCAERRVRFVASFHSQREALKRNLGKRPAPATVSPLDELATTRLALMRLPKSLDLFALYLAQIARSAEPGTAVAVGFMTRHFTPRLLEVAGAYAGAVEQSKAQRKARLLLLSDFRTDLPGPSELLHCFDYADQFYRQYYGVFSAGHVDYATQFLLDHWPEGPVPARLLDVGCGNGVIGNVLLQRYPDAQLTAMDDSVLAVASARLNLPPGRATVHCEHRLADLPPGLFDLIVTNPPFHFGHENNIEVSLGLFQEARRRLAAGGQLIVVANRHLNYGTHLRKLFPGVELVAAGDKFEVLRGRADG